MSTPAQAPFRLVALLTALAGCGGALQAVPANPVTDPGVLLARMQARRDTLRTLSATTRMEQYSDRGVVKGRVTLLVDAAGRLRADAWSPSDDLLAAMTASPEGFTYFERGADACITGQPCRSNLARLLPLGLDLADATAALFGIPPLRPAAGPWTMEFDRSAGAYRLESPTTSGAVQRVWIREDGVPVRGEVLRDGAREYRMEAQDLGDDGLPRTIRVTVARDRTDLTIKFRSLDLDPAIDPGDWAVECPRGLPLRTLDCEESP
jgi:hypothetical protein